MSFDLPLQQESRQRQQSNGFDPSFSRLQLGKSSQS